MKKVSTVLPLSFLSSSRLSHLLILHPNLLGPFLSLFLYSAYDCITSTPDPLQATWDNTHTHAAVSNRQLYYILTVIDCTPPVCGPNRFTSWLLLSAWVINTIIEDKWTEKEIYVIPIKETHQAWLAVKRQWHDDANALTGSFTSSNTRTNIEHNKH